MQRTGLVVALIVLALFGIYQFRIYRVAAMEEETKQAHEHLLTWQEQAKVRQAEAVIAAAKAVPVLQIPTPGLSCGDAYKGALAAIQRQGEINHANRVRLEAR